MTEKVCNIVNGRNVCIMVHGKSIYELENRIEELKDYDICWVSMSAFDMMETFILNKINKRLSIVQDCGELEFTVLYDEKLRIPRWENFLKRRDKNLILTATQIVGNLNNMGRQDIDYNFREKIEYIPKSMWSLVPNGLTLLLTYLGLSGTKKIILFGCDGYNGELNKDLDSYYHKELIKEERMLGFHNENTSGLHSDSYSFNSYFPDFFNRYSYKSQQTKAEIVNCSPNSMFTIFRKINYDQLKEELK